MVVKSVFLLINYVWPRLALINVVQINPIHAPNAPDQVNTFSGGIRRKCLRYMPLSWKWDGVGGIFA